MYSVQRREPRYAFTAPTEVIDTETTRTLAASTGELNHYSCFVKTLAPFAQGARIKLRISHAGLSFMAHGRVAYATESGMGIVFSMVEADDKAILDKWLEQGTIDASTF